MRFLRWVLALVVAAFATYVLAVVLNSQFVIAGHNVPVTLGDRLNMTTFDVSNMLLYLAIIAVALLLGFGIAGIVKRFASSLSSIAYPIAGAAAIGGTLGLMYLQFQTVPISGARSALGFASQIVAGGLGGWVFAKVLSKLQPA